MDFKLQFNVARYKTTIAVRVKTERDIKGNKK